MNDALSIRDPLTGAITGAAPTHAADFVTLMKPRVNGLVVATTFTGFYMAAPQDLDVIRLANTVIGTFLVAAGAAVVNQIVERNTDALMTRTRNRPIPAGRIQPSTAWLFAFALTGVGLLQLAVGSNMLAAAVAAVTFAIYVGVYTPLKRYTSLATLVGAVPGALPPLIGWAAARGELTFEGWILFAMVFLWQMPHFLAIAWFCRDDYKQAGFPMLPVLEPDGRSTAAQILLYGAVLIPVSLIPSAIGMAGRTYLVAALALGLLFLALAGRFVRRRDRPTARQLFLGSVAYLPLVGAAMLLDRIV